MAEATVGLLRVILTANTAEFESAMKRTASAATAWSKDLKSIGQQATQLGAGLTRTLTVPLLGIGLGAAKLAMDFESSFAGVRKTVKATEPEFKVMEQQFRDLAKTIPVNVNELNRLAESAGAMDIPKDAIVDFTRVMALLGVTTNVTSEQAATDIGKIQNIFGAAGKDTDRFAATLVALGNEGASTEQEILSMATRIAAAGHTVGMTQGQVLAFGSALSSVGLEAEAGGTAISRTFFTINDAVMSGGSALTEFARVAGMSAESFKKAFQDDAASATTAFISGLARIKGEGENVNQTLKGLELGEIRVRDTLIRAAGAGDLLTKALKLQGTAWEENTAHTKEAAERFKTTESQMLLLWNRVKDVGITLGNALLPAINQTIQFLDDLIPLVDKLASGFGKLPVPVQGLALGLGAVAAAAGPALWLFGQLVTTGGLLAAAFGTKGIAGAALTGAGGLKAMELAAIGLGTAFGALMVVIGSAILVSRAIDQASKLVSERAERAAGEATESARRYAMIAQAAQIAGHSIHSYADAVLIVTEHQRKLADELERSGGAITGFIGPLEDDFVGPLQAAGAAASSFSGQLAAVQRAVAALTAEQRGNIIAADKLGESNENIAKSLGIAEPVVKLFLDSLKNVGKTAAEVAEGPLKKFRTRVIELNAQMDAAKNEGPVAWRIALEELGDALIETGKRAKMFGEALPDGLALAVRIAINKEDAAREVERLRESMQLWLEMRPLKVLLLPSTGPGALDLSKTWQPYAAALGQMVDGIWHPGKGNNQGINYGKAIMAGIGTTLQGLPDLLVRAFTGGGGVLGALKSLGVQIADSIARPLMERIKALGPAISARLNTAIGLGTSGAAALGGAFGGSTGATIATIAGSMGGLVLATTAWGASMAAAGVAGSLALGAATAGIGLAAVGVYLLAKRFLGVSKDIKEARKAVEEFQDQLAQTLTPQMKAEAGGQRWKETILAVGRAYVGTGRSAEQARQAVEALWDTDNPLRAQRAMQEIAAIMEEFGKNVLEAEGVFDSLMKQAELSGGTIPAHMRPVIEQFIAMGLLTEDQIASLRALGDEAEFDWKRMEDAGKRYGDWIGTELGGKFQQAKIGDTAKSIINDFDMLTKGGASVGSVLFGMREEIAAVVKDSIKFGTTIPANMKPWIDNLFETGNLIEENGDKITDISGLKYGEAIKTEAEIAKEGWAAILAKIEELIAKITGPLLTAIDRVPREVEVDFTGTWTPPDMTTQPVPMATGGIVTRPTLALLGERGPELVSPLSALSSLPGVYGPGHAISQVGVKDSRQLEEFAERIVEGINRHMDRVLATFDETMRIGLRDAIAGAV